MVAHCSTVENGKWTIQALGNGSYIENEVEEIADENFKRQGNTLLINGPSVGESRGWPTRYQMGAGFEAGLQLLEKGIKATHIVMHGNSLGGGMMGEAILCHDFTKGMEEGVRYLSISKNTFDKLSHIASDIVGELVSDTVGRVVEPMFYITGTELDGVGAAKKLSELGIRHVVIQHCSDDNSGTDGVISDRVSLAHGIRQKGVLAHKIFLESDKIRHNGFLPKDIRGQLDKEINQFFMNANL